MSKEEIKNLLIEFVCEYDFTSWSNDNVYEKFSDLICKRFADLEAKLAESEEKCEELKQAISKCSGELPPNVAFEIANDDIRYQIICNLTDRNQEHRNTIKQLKQQLDEKEKQIKNLNLEAQKYYEDAYCNDFHNQDKISFAVEKLKETQIYVDNQHFMSARYKCEKKVYAAIWNFIDNQIKQLKEGK